MELIEISSTINITVTKGLSAVNMTDPNARYQNSFNVKENWTGTCVNLTVGAHAYPACIKDWPTVKALAAKRLITIGQPVSENEADGHELAAAQEAQSKIDAAADVENSEKKRRRRAEKKAEEAAE